MKILLGISLFLFLACLAVGLAGDDRILSLATPFSILAGSSLLALSMPSKK